MGILRIQKTGNYTTITNDCFNDERLSYRAVGLLCHLMSKPNDWQVRTSDLTKSHREGRDAVIATLNELIRCGYITREKGFGEVIYAVSEIPIVRGEHQEPDFQATENPSLPKTEATKEQKETKPRILDRPYKERAAPGEAPTPDLLRFINAYPEHRRRCDMDALRRAWHAALGSVSTVQEIFAGLEAQKASWKWQNEPMYIPGIIKWLNEGRWRDPVEPKPKARTAFKTQADWNSASNEGVVL